MWSIPSSRDKVESPQKYTWQAWLSFSSCYKDIVSAGPKEVGPSDIRHFVLDQHGWLQLSYLLQPPLARQDLLNLSSAYGSPGSCWAQSCIPHSRLSLCHLSPAPPPPAETLCGKDTAVCVQLLSAQRIFRNVDFCVIFWPLWFFFLIYLFLGSSHHSRSVEVRGQLAEVIFSCLLCGPKGFTSAGQSWQLRSVYPLSHLVSQLLGFFQIALTL